MPREKGRPGHAAIRVDSDIGKKEKKIASLFPIIEHMRWSLDSSPDYAGMSEFLDDAVDALVLDILESPADAPVGIQMLYRMVLESPVMPQEGSIHLYSVPTVEPIRVREVPLGDGSVALVDDEDYEGVSEYRWQPSFAADHYALRRFKNDDGKTIREAMHDFLMNTPDGYAVIHVDGDKLNNVRTNLQLVKIEKEGTSNEED